MKYLVVGVKNKPLKKNNFAKITTAGVDQIEGMLKRQVAEVTNPREVSNFVIEAPENLDKNTMQAVDCLYNTTEDQKGKWLPNVVSKAEQAPIKLVKVIFDNTWEYEQFIRLKPYMDIFEESIPVFIEDVSYDVNGVKTGSEGFRKCLKGMEDMSEGYLTFKKAMAEDLLKLAQC